MKSWLDRATRYLRDANLNTHEQREFHPQQLLGFGVAMLAFIVLIGLFTELSEEVAENDTLGFDIAVLESIRTVSSPTLDAVVLVATDLAGALAVGTIIAGLIGLLLYRKKHNAALLVAVAIGGAVMINLGLKALFQRARPDLWERVVVETSFSFPSGHAMASAAVAATLIVLAWKTRYRWYVVIGGVSYMIVIALTRMYLGVHYPTDIAAGWMVSFAWVIAVKTLFGFFLERNKRKKNSKKISAS